MQPVEDEVSVRRVIKVGGSLLERPDLQDALTRWISRQPSGEPSSIENLVVVGGGPLVDAVRDLDQLHPGDPEEIHWLCVELLDATFRLVSAWFDWPTISTSEEFEQAMRCGCTRERPTLVAVRSVYHRHQVPLPSELPCNWQTTSDSIAAWLARRSEADELVLLKSCSVDPAWKPEQLASCGIVDEVFPAIARGIAAVRVERLD